MFVKRWVAHIDVSCFYVSVMLLHYPRLRGRRVVVGGNTEERHGIVLAKSYEAKAFGIRTGMSLFEAHQKCPDLIVLPPDYQLFQSFSKRLFKLLYNYSPFVESYGVDEAWICLSHCENPEAVVHEIQEQVWFQLGLPVSIGLGDNKIFAKLGSDYDKPLGITIITPENYKEKVWTLPVSDLLMVGRATADKMQKYGIKTIGEIATMSPDTLESLFNKWGLYLHTFANGWDDSPVAEYGSVRDNVSVSHSWTLPRDAKTEQDCRIVFRGLSEGVAAKLRAMNMRSRTVQVWLRGNDLSSLGRQVTLPRATLLSSELTEAAMQLLRKHYRWERPLRSLGIRAMNLVPAADQPEQLSLFVDETYRQKQETIAYTNDGIHRRFGDNSVFFGLKLLDKQLGGLDLNGANLVYPRGYLG